MIFSLATLTSNHKVTTDVTEIITKNSYKESAFIN